MICTPSSDVAKVGDLVQTSSRGWKGLYRVQRIQGSFTAILEDYFTREFKGNWAIKDLKVIQAYPAASHSLRLRQDSMTEPKTEAQPKQKDTITESAWDIKPLASPKNIPIRVKEVQITTRTGEPLERKALTENPISPEVRKDGNFTVSAALSVPLMKEVRIVEHIERAEMSSQPLTVTRNQLSAELKATVLPLHLKKSEKGWPYDHHLSELKLFGNETQQEIQESVMLIHPSPVSALNIFSHAEVACQL